MSSERPGAREAINKLAQKWTQDGMDPKRAKEKAIEVAKKYDRQNPR